jgi:hypothetical protein
MQAAATLAASTTQPQATTLSSSPYNGMPVSSQSYSRMFFSSTKDLLDCDHNNDKDAFISMLINVIVLLAIDRLSLSI